MRRLRSVLYIVENPSYPAINFEFGEWMGKKYEMQMLTAKASSSLNEWNFCGIVWLLFLLLYDAE